MFTITLNYALVHFLSLKSGISDRQETFQWMFTHIAVVRDLVAMQYKEYQEVPHLHHYQTLWVQEFELLNCR